MPAFFPTLFCQIGDKHVESLRVETLDKLSQVNPG